MGPSTIIEAIRGRGLSVRYDRTKGKLIVSPPGKLTQEERGALLAHRQEVCDWLVSEESGNPPVAEQETDQAVLDYLAQRTREEDCPPVEHLDLAVLYWPGEPPLVADRRAVEGWRRWNALARQHPPGQRRPPAAGRLDRGQKAHAERVGRLARLVRDCYLDAVLAFSPYQGDVPGWEELHQLGRAGYEAIAAGLLAAGVTVPEE